LTADPSYAAEAKHLSVAATGKAVEHTQTDENVLEVESCKVYGDLNLFLLDQQGVRQPPN